MRRPIAQILYRPLQITGSAAALAERANSMLARTLEATSATGKTPPAPNDGRTRPALRSAAVLRLLGRSAHFVCQTESAHQARPPQHNEERDRKGRAARQHCKALSQSGSPSLSKQARALTITRRDGTRAGRRAAGRAAGAARGPKSLLQWSRKPGWQGSTASTASSTAPHANSLPLTLARLRERGEERRRRSEGPQKEPRGCLQLGGSAPRGEWRTLRLASAVAREKQRWIAARATMMVRALCGHSSENFVYPTFKSI